MSKSFRTFEMSNPAFQPEHLRFVTVKSKNLKGRGDCTLFIPPGITRITKEIPVVILLHGVYASHWAWAYNINVHGIALKLIEQKKIRPMILVMPSDGMMGDGSGYFDHGDRNFEKWIVEDVRNLVKKAIPCDSGKLSWCIAGLSMGGFGALRLMAKFPKLFAAASGLSSITRMKDLLPFLPKREQIHFEKNFGSEKLIDYFIKQQKRLSPFRFDCGIDDHLFKSNVKLHQQLVDAGIEHEFEEFAGGHSNEYWARHIEQTLVFFNRVA